MAANKVFNFGPVAVPAAAANLLNPPTAAGGVNAGASSQFIVLKHIRVINKTAAAVNISLFRGATGASAAGTEMLWSATPVPANSFIEAYGAWRFDAADFLVGLASVVTSLVIQGEGEIGVSG